MKKIMFEKLTVKETAHIRGALSTIDGYTDEPDSLCTDPTYNANECGGPGIPHVECAASEPSVECGTRP